MFAEERVRGEKPRESGGVLRVDDPIDLMRTSMNVDIIPWMRRVGVLTEGRSALFGRDSVIAKRVDVVRTCDNSELHSDGDVRSSVWFGAINGENA